VSQAFPTWLEQFQDRFGRMIRTPLERANGSLRVAHESYDEALTQLALASERLGSNARLALYNRQYWFRLFTLFHGAFPLTTRLLSHFTFNGYVSCFLVARPPRHWDIEAMLAGFDEFLQQALPAGTTPIEGQRASVDTLAVLEAARIDSAFHRVFRAPAFEAFRPSGEHAAHLLTSRLIASPASAVLEEHWPLCELRPQIVLEGGEAARALPPRLEAARHWLLLRPQNRLALLPLEAREARLLRLLSGLSVECALAQLEQECPAEERASLPEATQRWLARSVALGIWVGLEGPTMCELESTATFAK